MKKAAIATFAILLSLCVAGNVLAESATKKECIAKSKEAAKMIEDKGLDAAVAEINKKDGKFVWKDTYVFLMDMNGKMLAHPMKPALVGKNLMGSTDKAEKGKEKLLFKEFVELAKTKGDGWVDYMWPNPVPQGIMSPKDPLPAGTRRGPQRWRETAPDNPAGDGNVPRGDDYCHLPESMLISLQSLGYREHGRRRR